AAIFTMDSKLEQRTCIKFCCKNEIKCSDTLKMLQKCYGDDTLSKTQWYERFKSGREAVEDDARPGRPSTSKTDENVDEGRTKGQTVNKEYYLGVMKRLCEAIRKKRSALWGNNSWILHDDNAPSHNALIIREFLLKSLEALMAIPKTDFQKSFEGWIKRWHKCIAADGDYFEGDNLNFEE
ncbi:GVQW3 protein, partial [Acromyrmex heyeri]